jgi:hypothetical protein
MASRCDARIRPDRIGALMTFPVTRQSVVRDLASTDPAARAAAYDALARS